MFFGDWNRTIIMLARTTRNCPGRMNTSHEQETSIIYLRDVRMASARRRQARMADGLHHTKLLLSLAKGMARVARPSQREVEAKAGKIMRRRVGRV